MKTALLTLNINDCLCESARASFLDASRRWGCHYIEITEAPEGVYPSLVKLRPFNLGHDRVFYIDADTVIRGDCPSPFEIFPEGKFVAVRNQQPQMPGESYLACSNTIDSDLAKIGDRFGKIEFNREKFINSGVWLASKVHHQGILERALEISLNMHGITEWHDQSALNYALFESKFPVEFASIDWNYQFPPNPLPVYMDQHIYHWAGDHEGRKLRLPQCNWWAQGPTRERFSELLSERGYKSGVEIGVQNGDHAVLLLNNWPGNLVLVDPWQEQDRGSYDDNGAVSQEIHDRYHAKSVENMAPFGDRAKIIRNYSINTAKEFEDNSLGFVYFDGNHTYDAVTADLKAWYSKIRPGGMISGHDFTWDGNAELPKGGNFGVRPAVFDFLKERSPAILHVAKEEEWPTWYFIKPENRPRAICPVVGAKKRKLLWVGDAVVHTGFARVTHCILERLKEKWDVSVIGVNYHGDPHTYDYPIYPASLGGDLWGMNRLKELSEKIKPDVILALQDPWIAKLFVAKNDRKIPIACYMPVDAINLHDETVRAFNGGLDLAVWYTKFGRTQATATGWTGRNSIIPHGVDTEIYRPLDKREARRRMQLSRSLPEDCFIFGNVNRNSPRKRLDLSLFYFAEWVRNYDIPENVFLYLHCALKDGGWDLPQLGHYFGISSRLLLAGDRVTPAQGLDEAEMPWLYNSFDVQISTTEGEGFGLTNAEGMACGIPQLAPDWSALPEWGKDAMIFIHCSGITTNISHINTIGGVVDKEAFIAALDRLYREKELRGEYSRKGFLRVREPQFRWENVAEKFHVELTQLVEGPKYRTIEDLIADGVQIPA